MLSKVTHFKDTFKCSLCFHLRTHPLEHVYRETYKTIVNLRNSTMSAQAREGAEKQ